LDINRDFIDFGGGGRGEKEPPEETTESLATKAINVLKRATLDVGAMGIIATNLSLAAVGNPQNAPGAFAAGIGSIPGAEGLGNFLGAIAELGDAVLTVSKDLMNFSAPLFSVMTQFEFAIMGLKFQIADEIGPVLADLVPVIFDLIAASAELFVMIGKGLLPVLVPLIELFTLLVKGVTHLLNAFQLVTTWIFKEYYEADTKEYEDKVHREGLARLRQKRDEGLLSEERYNQLVEMSRRNKNQFQGGFDDPSSSINTLMMDQNKEFDKSWESVLESFGKFSESLSDMTNNVDRENKRFTDAMRQGAEIAMALFTASSEWARDPNNAQGPQFMPQRFRRDTVPNISGLSPAQTYVQQQGIAQAGGESVPGLPRPTSAALHLKMTDSIEIKAADEDRLHMEILQLKNQLFTKIRGMNDRRFVELMSARVSAGIGH